MKSFSSRNRALAVVSAASVATTNLIVQASSDFNNNNGSHSHNRNHNQYNPHSSSSCWYDSSPYLYNEIDLSAADNSEDEQDYDHDAYHMQQNQKMQHQQQEEDSSWHFSASTVSDSDWTDLSSDESTLVASSLLYEGGCYVSSQAIMCQGGGEAGDVASRTSADDAILRHFMEDDTYSDLLDSQYDEEEDDDDGEDDGHSSMLSNSSLKRSKTGQKTRCYAGGAGRSDGQSQEIKRASCGVSLNSQNGVHVHRRFEPSFLQRRRRPSQRSSSSPSLSSALLVRGGAAAAASDLTKKLINAAIVTLIFEGCCGHILEFFKIVMQTSPPGTTYGSVFKDITSEKGISGLWDGFVPWGVLQAVLKGGVFGFAYEAAEKILVPLADDGKIPMKLAMTLAGGIAGGFQGFVLSPTLLMKTRVMTNEIFRESMSLWQTTWKSMVIGGDIIKTEGLGSLMKGANTFATKRVFDWASRYFFADLFEALFVHMKGGSLSVSEKITASLLGGVASTVLTLPLDVLVAKTQDAKKAGVKVSAWKLFSEELEKEGWVGLKNNYMSGFEARLLHVCLTTVVMKTMAPIVYNILFGK